MKVFAFDHTTLLFSGACEVDDGTPLGPHQTTVPLDLTDKRSPQYVFDGKAWRYSPRVYDAARAAAEMAGIAYREKMAAAAAR